MKLKFKILALNIAALLIMLTILGPIIIKISDNYNLSNILNYLKSQGDNSTIYVEQYILSKAGNIFEVPSIMESDSSYLCSYLNKNIKCRVQIFYGNKLLGDSEDITDNNKNIRPEVSETFKGNKAYIITKNKTRTLYYATPVNIDGRYNYSLAFIYDLSDADNMKKNNINMFIITGLLAAFFSVVFSNFISDRIIRPIKDLTETAKLLSKGDLHQKVEVKSNDEVGELGENFNSMADSLRNMIHELKDEKEKQKSFFDNFTHEIRTPLTTILGYSELLWKTDSIEVKDKSLFHITSEGKRMLNMVERLLELSRLKRYDFQINKSETNLKALLEEVCDSIHYKLGRYNISLDLKLQNLSVFVDPDLFKQVIINILDNSIKYSDTSKIDITLESKDGIELIIKDYGVGIDPDTLENIFEPYYKGDKSRNSSIEGWGLGLSIVKEIIDKHGARIELISHRGEGTQVIIRL
ncbi:sensor histidine kinase [Lutispora sp.]|uniref:sensor histidine kinase n=1 Tax=Lutispora sp. TaxID=2828727 RepID=UPI002B1FDE92|nr:HAMP domain-containing sensor histidine kinase [Lutispora sp.]MEA4960297.1 HAMP domain-containing sensor histidine kinase [Lutispora sp.]